jgi:hypothetical protein
LPRASDKQSNSANQRQTAEDRRERDLLLRVLRGMDGPHIKDLFAMGVRNALIGEGQRTQDYEHDPSYRDQFHMLLSPSRDDPPASKEPHQNDHNRQNQQNVDEPAECVGRGDSQEPQNKQDHRHYPQHIEPLVPFSSAQV